MRVVAWAVRYFGARICSRLALEPDIDIVARAAGEQREKSTSVQTACSISDAPDLTSKIRSLAPDLVIHCAGPFQGQDYRVALASLACGAHYADLADGRAFVAGFAGAIGTAAQAAKRVAITGASTLPALSSAVVDLSRHLSRS